MTVNANLQDAAIRHALLLEGFKAGEVAKIQKFLKNDLFPDLADTVRRRLSRISLAGGLDSGPWRTKRYQDMLSSIDRMMGNAFKKVSADSVDSMNKFALSEERFQRASIDRALPFESITRAPSPATLKAVTTARPFQGKHLKDWWKNVDQHGRDIIKRQLSIGIASGEGIETIVKRLTGNARSSFGPGAFKTIQRNARVVTRTAVTHVSNAAREATFKANESVIKSVKFVATLDARTTDICASIDGRTFAINSGPRPPMHHQCRSTIVPITKSLQQIVDESKGIKNKVDKSSESIKSTRAELRGEVPASQTYGPWLKGQPKEIQDFALGKKRADLFRRGHVDIRQFTDRKFQPLTLQELEQVERDMLRRASGKKVVKKKTAIKKTASKIEPTARQSARSLSGIEETAEEVREKLFETARQPIKKDSLIGREILKDIEGLEFRIAKLEKINMTHVSMYKDAVKKVKQLKASFSKGFIDDLPTGFDVQITSGQRKAAMEALGVKNKAKVKMEFASTNKFKRTMRNDAIGEMRQSEAWFGDKLEIPARLNEAEDFLSSVISKKLIDEDFLIRVGRSLDDNGNPASRAYAKVGSIHISNKSATRTIVHEFTHNVEFKSLTEKARDFLKKRALRSAKKLEAVDDDMIFLLKEKADLDKQLKKHKARLKKIDKEIEAAGGEAKMTGPQSTERLRARQGVKNVEEELRWNRSGTEYRRSELREPRKLGDIFPNKNYSADERAWEDDFFSAYAGKDYGEAATEILSMGAEFLYSNPYEFARVDPEYFDFIVNILRGN